jgi:hypothetical protein
MLAIVNGGPSDLWVPKHSPGMRESVIIGVKIHGNGVLLALQTRRWPMAFGKTCLGGLSFFSTHLVFYIYPTERRVLSNFLLGERRRSIFRSTSFAELSLLSALSRLYSR